MPARTSHLRTIHREVDEAPGVGGAGTFHDGGPPRITVAADLTRAGAAVPRWRRHVGTLGRFEADAGAAPGKPALAAVDALATAGV